MRRLSIENKPITAFGTTGVAAYALTRVGKVEGAAVDVLAFEPGAVLGRHPTRVWQLFSVVSGRGWASGADAVRHPLVPGDAVLWEPDEEHETGTEDGMVAVVVQTPISPLADSA
jgi:quercetin dioxygenase-like cupin family protein